MPPFSAGPFHWQAAFHRANIGLPAVRNGKYADIFLLLCVDPPPQIITPCVEPYPGKSENSALV